MPTVAAELLRPDLLGESSILVVTASSAHDDTSAESFGRSVCETCEWLGARVHPHARDLAAGEAEMDATVATAASEMGGIDTPGGIDMLVVDGAAMFASGGLRECLDGTWDATRAVVNLAFLRDESTAAHTRRIVYLAPSPGAARSRIVPQADAARAGLENLARTLSVEWARHEIKLVTIALGDESTAGEVAALCAYLASPAGAYFSGCQLDLRGLAETRAV